MRRRWFGSAGVLSLSLGAGLKGLGADDISMWDTLKPANASTLGFGNAAFKATHIYYIYTAPEGPELNCAAHLTWQTSRATRPRGHSEELAVLNQGFRCCERGHPSGICDKQRVVGVERGHAYLPLPGIMLGLYWRFAAADRDVPSRLSHDIMQRWKACLL